jgi:hypothetical protein
MKEKTWCVIAIAILGAFCLTYEAWGCTGSKTTVKRNVGSHGIRPNGGARTLSPRAGLPKRNVGKLGMPVGNRATVSRRGGAPNTLHLLPERHHVRRPVVGTPISLPPSIVPTGPSYFDVEEQARTAHQARVAAINTRYNSLVAGMEREINTQNYMREYDTDGRRDNHNKELARLRAEIERLNAARRDEIRRSRDIYHQEVKPPY